MVENIVKGDWLLGRNEHDPAAPVRSYRVEETFIREALLWELKIAGQTIRTTAEHPFWVEGRGWTAVQELQVGERVLSEVGAWLRIESLRDTQTYAVVYNFRVAGAHTYFVGCPEWGFSVWVHNAYAGAKRGPKTDLTAPHNATIRAVAARLEAEGNTILNGGGRAKEVVIKTPGGFKGTRRPDILYRTPTGEIRAVNVGRVMADGSPVPREVRALADLNRVYPTTFVPYFQ